ncbi:MAG: mechanosensitive ion channel protein MscS [Halobacteriovoraceae bacterium]|nr:mechanosensitive ion channel protein MscS [Halobacteriovoraceae bacterium]
MKTLLCFLLASLMANANVELDSPRATFKTFLKAMVDVKNNQNVSQSYARAKEALDLSGIDPAAQKEAAIKISESLIYIFDRMERINYEKIPLEPKAEVWVYDKKQLQDNSIEISLAKIDSKWLFSKDTIESIPAYKELLKDKSIVEGVVKLKTWRETLRKALPAWSQKEFLFIEAWQWIGLLFLVIVAYLIEKVISFIGRQIINKNVHAFKENQTQVIKKAMIPFGKIILLYLVFINLSWLDFEPTQLAFIKRTIYVLSALAAVWLGHRVVELLSYYFNEKASLTESKFDDIIIPLATKTSFVFVYILGILLIAASLTIDVTGILAGLGIGGLAFAFAAKDTLANFFGSIMLVLDRPFDIGDVITTGDIEGTVVEVGFRSTRIRTFYDSIITVSNGELMNRAIDNKGKRRYRRLNTTLGVEYDTPPEKVEAFCEGIRQLILSNKWTRKDNFNVYFTNFGASSLDIQLMVFWETSEYAREQAEKHRLMIDVLRLAKELEVNFAFPTQTVHLFNETSKPEHKVPEKYLDEGIGRAKGLLGKPLSLKNPRSNANDEEQFGKNDIGN